MKHSWKAEGDEMTMARREPNQREKMSLCVFDVQVKKWWKGRLRRLRFPIMGRGGGPGGRFLYFLLWENNSLNVRKNKGRK